KSPSCAADADCVSGFCVVSGGTGTCTPKKARGATCAADRECSTSVCADTVCCDRTCTGSCEFCNVAGGGAGTCSFVTGTPRTGHPAGAGGTTSCAGRCNGTKATCTSPGAETTCRQPSCSGTTATNQAVCDGIGGCPGLTTTACSPFVCGTVS